MSEWIDEFVKPAPPKPHSLTSTIGWCPECREIHIHDSIEDLVKAGSISRRLREKFPEQLYVCKDCGVPLAKTRDDAYKLDGCWFCGGKTAIPKDKFEEYRRKRK